MHEVCMRPLFQLAFILGVFEAQPAQAVFPVIHAVAIEMDHGERLAPLPGLLQGLFQRRAGGRIRMVRSARLAQVLHGLQSTAGR